MTYSGTKRKVFFSYYRDDRPAVNKFVDRWSDVFIAKNLVAYDDRSLICGNDGDYILSKIRNDYLEDSTVTLVLMGTCTHSRRYIDWEIKSSLRQGCYAPNGLLGVVLPNLSDAPHIPERFSCNWNNASESYAEYYHAPSSEEQLGRWIEHAYNARAARSHLIKNTQDMWSDNKRCSHCSVNH